MMGGHRALCFQFSCKKCCLFFLIIIIFFVLVIASLSLIIIFVFKPRRPIFSFQTMNIASYKFDVSDSSTVFLSLVAYVTLISHNPNRVGIRYDFSRLKILDHGVAVGMLRIPEFYQPARSHNVSIRIDILFQRLDISTIMSGGQTRNFPIKVLGDIGVHLWVLHIKLPKIKVGFRFLKSRLLVYSRNTLFIKRVLF
ncbi:hypothetical protein HanPI659440_Chr15g0617861 [Helianthus annuus]|nr:hypothetical protein HanPI659440_Chr15g0617861 [Helianthus annuus]